VSHLKSQSEAKNVHGGEGGVGGVGVSQLEDFDEDQHHHDVHHRGVELEADVGGTDMEDHAEEALHIKIIIRTNTIMMYIIVVSNWRLMLEGQIWKITLKSPCTCRS
jgi:hypothetical protein